MLSKTSFYILDIVKDVRFIILILIALLPESKYLIVVAFGSLIISEIVKMIQLYFNPGKMTLEKILGVLFSVMQPILLHHKEFMAKIQLQNLAAMQIRSPEQEAQLINVRRELQNILLVKAELRATENILEHFPQVIISLSVLTLEGAAMQLDLTDGKKLFFLLSLTGSLFSIVRGQINLISARKNGQLGLLAKLFLTAYLVIAIVPRIFVFTALISGQKALESLTALTLVAIIHIGISYAIQRITFREDQFRFRQALWTILTPPLFLDWDTLYRQQMGKISIPECWKQTKHVILGHNLLNLLENIALGHLVSSSLLPVKSVSFEIDTIIKLAVMLLSQIALVALSFNYFKTRHPWARILNSKLSKRIPGFGNKYNSEPILNQTNKAKVKPFNHSRSEPSLDTN